MADTAPFTLNSGNSLTANPSGVRGPAPTAFPQISGGGANAFQGQPGIALQGTMQQFDPMRNMSLMMNTILGMQELKQRKIAEDISKIERAIAMNAQLSNVLEPLLKRVDADGNPIKLTAEDIVGESPRIASILGLDLKKGSDASKLAELIAPVAGAEDPHAKTKDLVASMASENVRLERLYGTILQQDQGGFIVPIEVNRVEGISRPLPRGQAIERTLSPQERSAMTSIAGPQGETITGPRAQIAPTFTGGGKMERAQPNALGGVSTMPAPMFSAPVRSITPEIQHADQQGIASANEFVKELDQAALNWVPLETIMEVQREALSKFKAGGGAPLRGTLAKMAQAARNLSLGALDGVLTDENIDKIAGGDLAAFQTFQAAAASEAVLMMKQAVQGTGRAMIPEVNIFLERYGDAGNDPRALERIYDFVTSMGKKLKDMQTDASTFQTEKRQNKRAEPYGNLPKYVSDRARERGNITYENTEDRKVRGAPAALGTGGAIVTLQGTTDAELDEAYRKLKPGTKFKGPDGVVRTKP